MIHQQCKGLFTPKHSITVTVTLTGSTFDLFDGHCDGKNRLHTDFAVNVTFVAELLGVN